MEASGKTQAKVGAFVIIGLLVVMVSIFMIGGDKSLFTGRIRVFAFFDNVQGLAEGSVVSLSGIVVGNVEKLDFIRETNQIKVTLVIDKTFSNRVTKGAQVEIRTQGALGDKYVFLLPGQAGAEPVPEGSVLEVAKATDLLGIFAERGKETEKVFDIINEIYGIAKTVNADRRLEKVMINLASASDNLQNSSVDVRRFTTGLASTDTAKIQDSLSRLDSVLAKIDRGEGTLGALINDPTLHERLKALLGGSARRQHVKSILRTSIEKSEE